MELRDLEYFRVIAEYHHVNHAAEALGISQPALSKCIARLERELNAKVFIRTPKGVELTMVGRALLTRVRKLRLSFDDVQREVVDIANGVAGELRIGAAPAVADYLVAPACAAMLRTSRDAMLTVTVAMNDFLVPALREGTLDLIVSGVPQTRPDEFAYRDLLDDEFVVIARRSHRRARLQRPTLSDLSQSHWVAPPLPGLSRQWLMKRFVDLSLPQPKIEIETNSPQLMLRLIESTDLLGFQSRQILRSSNGAATILHASELSWRRHVAVSYRRDAYLPPIATRLIDCLNEVAKKLAGKHAPGLTRE